MLSSGWCQLEACNTRIVACGSCLHCTVNPHTGPQRKPNLTSWDCYAVIYPLVDVPAESAQQRGSFPQCELQTRTMNAQVTEPRRTAYATTYLLVAVQVICAL